MVEISEEDFLRLSISNSPKFKVFHFNQTILGQHKADLAEYFMGLKNFIYYAQGKNVGVNIEVNGSLQLQVYSDNEQDLELVKDSIADYIFNLKNVDNKPSIRIGAGSQDPEKALIFLQSKLYSIQTSLQLKDSSLLQADNKIAFLESVVNDLQSHNQDLQTQNKTLQDELKQALAIISQLQNQIIKIKTSNLQVVTINSNLDILLNLLGTLTLVINQKNDKSLIKKIINQISDHEKINHDFYTKIKLPKINISPLGVGAEMDLSNLTVSTIVQQIVSQLYRKF